MESGGRPSLGQFILLGSSSVVTAILFSVYRQKAQVSHELKGAKKIPLGEDLKSILSEAPGKCVPYAVIEGAVRSVKETLNSQFVENCKGVIQRLTLQEHKMVWNRTTHLWNDCSKIIHQRTNTVPFDLVPHEDGVGMAVRVLKPLDSVDLGLETVYEKFHPSIQSFTDVIGHYISGKVLSSKLSGQKCEVPSPACFLNMSHVYRGQKKMNSNTSVFYPNECNTCQWNEEWSLEGAVEIMVS